MKFYNAKLPRSENDSIGLIHENSKIVSSISASIQSGTTKYIGNIINYSATNSWWCGQTNSYGFFEISFTRPSFIFNCSFSTHTWKQNLQSHPQQLLIEAFLNNELVSSTKISKTGLNPECLSRTFALNHIGLIDSLKISQTAPNYNGDKTFCLYKFDVFGFSGSFPTICQRTSISRYFLVYLIIYLI